MFTLLAGRLYGSARPGQEVLDGLLDAGVELVVSLTARPLEEDLKRQLRAMEIDYLHVPVEDFSPPTAEQMDRIYRAYRQVVKRGGAVLVHCGAGLGRTGTVLACLLGAEKRLSARAAIKRVRKVRPGAVETAAQEKFVAEWLGRRRKRRRR